MELIRQINTHFEKDDYEKVVSMMIEDRDFNKAEFVRKLIRQEWARRHPEAEIPEIQKVRI